jgi:hypothetical protein
MNWPEAMVTVVAIICGVNLIKTLLRFIDGKLR